jgi:hypothetical protein
MQRDRREEVTDWVILAAVVLLFVWMAIRIAGY